MIIENALNPAINVFFLLLLLIFILYIIFTKNIYNLFQTFDEKIFTHCFFMPITLSLYIQILKFKIKYIFFLYFQLKNKKK